MSYNVVRARLTDYAVFKDGEQKLGMADVTLPDIEYLADSIKGPGIGGEVNMPTMSMVGALPITINWRIISEDLTELAAPKAHDLEFRGAQQQYDSATGEMEIVPVVINVRALPTKMALGKFEVGATTDSSSEMEAVYLKITVDGQVRTEIDKFARVFTLNGTDYMADIRAALGL